MPSKYVILSTGNARGRGRGKHAMFQGSIRQGKDAKGSLAARGANEGNEAIEERGVIASYPRSEVLASAIPGLCGQPKSLGTVRSARSLDFHWRSASAASMGRGIKNLEVGGRIWMRLCG